MADIKAIKGTDGTTYNLRDDYSVWGGNNLFSYNGLKTRNQELTLNAYQNAGSFTQFTNSLQFDPSQTLGQRYTISFDIISPNGTTNVLLYNNNGHPKYFWFATVTLGSIGNTWTHFSYTVTNAQYSGTQTASTNEQIWRRIEIYCPSKMGCKVRNIKVELGDKATDWSPCYKDIFSVTGTTLNVNL